MAISDATAWTRVQCSMFSLYDVFGGRDELMQAVFEQHSHIHDIEEFFNAPHGELIDTVRGFYRTVAEALSREPRVAPAMYAEVFARPDSPAVKSLISYSAPRMFGVLGRWFDSQISAGLIRDLPVPLLTQQLFGPILIHVFMRPVAGNALPVPDIDVVCDVSPPTSSVRSGFRSAGSRLVKLPRPRLSRTFPPRSTSGCNAVPSAHRPAGVEKFLASVIGDEDIDAATFSKA